MDANGRDANGRDADARDPNGRDANAREDITLYADLSIRRACAFAALAIGTVMLSLSFDLPLALRSGAAMMGVMCGVLLVQAWRSPRRDVRRTEFWSMFAASNPELVARADAARLRATARRIWHARLIWHAERVGLAALALWAGAGLAMVARLHAGG